MWETTRLGCNGLRWPAPLHFIAPQVLRSPSSRLCHLGGCNDIENVSADT